MGIDFKKPNRQAETAETTTATQTVTAEVIEESPSQKYDIVADTQQMERTLSRSPEVDALTSQIEVDNMESIVTFGAETAEAISRASDTVLNSMDMSQLTATSTMLNELAKVMDKFDIDEIKDDPGLFGKIFG
ncbi:MAG: toxic anion resistance protein, partial [Ruminococcus sp.]|nr:toxic anion resistance protein [Ruminococcus sp.]